MSIGEEEGKEERTSDTASVLGHADIDTGLDGLADERAQGRTEVGIKVRVVLDQAAGVGVSTSVHENDTTKRV